MPVTPHYLLQGAALSLEQCGLLLRDANALYRSGSYATTIVLAAFAREELGRYKILLDLGRRARSGEALTVAQIKEACDDHVTKQRAGMLMVSITADRGSGVGKILTASMQSNPGSTERQKADKELEKIREKKIKRTPADRHEKRASALYVEPLSESEWNRPAATTASAAYNFLIDAVNDYAGPYHRVKEWADRPELCAPEWPPLPR